MHGSEKSPWQKENDMPVTPTSCAPLRNWDEVTENKGILD